MFMTTSYLINGDSVSRVWPGFVQQTDVIAGAVLIAGPDNDAGGSVGHTTRVQVVKTLAAAQVVISQSAALEIISLISNLQSLFLP
jgi:hypothetical protein